MRLDQQWLSRIIKSGLSLMAGISMSACAGWAGSNSSSWKEEVMLHDGKTVIVERSQSRGGRGEIGQSPIKEQELTFALPGSSELITWKDVYSKDVGHANFHLLALHVLDGTPYIVNSTYNCLAYNKWGRPNPPYVLFKYDGKAWVRIPLSEFPAEFREINLVINASAHEEKLIEETDKSGIVSAESVKRFNSSLKQPENKMILREPLSSELVKEMCQEMVFYKGAWIGPGDSIGKRMMDHMSK